MRLIKKIPIIALLLVVFMAGCKKDDAIVIPVNPTVTSTGPLNEAIDITTNSDISANFSTEMNSATITISSFTLQTGSESVLGTIEYAGTTAIFTPAVELNPSTLYTATVTKDIKDLSGTSLKVNYVWSFTTGKVEDLTPPRVTFLEPLNNSTGIGLNQIISVTFSEPMDNTTITSTTFKLEQGANIVLGAVSCTGVLATFTPAAPLDTNKLYTGTISVEAKDMAGNALESANVFSFTTGAAPDVLAPVINSTSPLNNATEVATNTVVDIIFSEAMDPLTINSSTFYLNEGVNVIAGTVSYLGETATFTPTNLLLAGLIYTATITNGAKDLAGNAIAANTTWSFTAKTASSNMPIVNLGAAGNYVILAKSAINNNSTSIITGDLGLSPAATSYATGFSLTDATGYATSAQITGKVYASDMADPTPINLTTAVENMITAYNDAAGRTTPDYSELGTGNIGGKTLLPGLYKWTTTVTMPSDVTISGGANDVWIFQISKDLLMSSAVKITLIGGAQAKNIFWQVAGQATFGTTSHVEGIIMSMTSINFQTGASLNGRALAQTAVVLDGNAINLP